MTGVYIALIASYPKSLELKVMEQRKNEVEEFTQSEQMIEVFRPKPFAEPSTPSATTEVPKK